MILLDTNVVSETLRARPNDAVIAWIDQQPFALVHLCTPVLAELRLWRRTARCRRAERFPSDGDQPLRERDLSRTYPGVRHCSCREFGRLFAARRKMGRPIATIDAFIAAIALSQGATLATRNTRHFADLGLDLINPSSSVRQRSRRRSRMPLRLIFMGTPEFAVPTLRRDRRARPRRRGGLYARAEAGRPRHGACSPRRSSARRAASGCRC